MGVNFKILYTITFCKKNNNYKVRKRSEKDSNGCLIDQITKSILICPLKYKSL